MRERHLEWEMEKEGERERENYVLMVKLEKWEETKVSWSIVVKIIVGGLWRERESESDEESDEMDVGKEREKVGLGLYIIICGPTYITHVEFSSSRVTKI